MKYIETIETWRESAYYCVYSKSKKCTWHTLDRRFEIIFIRIINFWIVLPFELSSIQKFELQKIDSVTNSIMDISYCWEFFFMNIGTGGSFFKDRFQKLNLNSHSSLPTNMITQTRTFFQRWRPRYTFTNNKLTRIR